MSDQQLKLAITTHTPFIRPIPASHEYMWEDSCKHITDREWLAVMEAVEKTLTDSQKSNYSMRLYQQVLHQQCTDYTVSLWFGMISRSWQQRAEAYLRTIGKYEEEEK